MNSVRVLRDEIAVVGWSCRLPGANSPTELWSLLLEGRCAVSSLPSDRFSLERFAHPRRQQPGKSYTWAAGVIDDPWGFDPGVFGISPREAVQMDPQQRILLQLTWEALEDAGIRPSSLAGSDVGVFIGASQTDYGHNFFTDHAIADAQFATGTALAVLANRISYIYDLRGPSVTVDTACSSSLVALNQAVEAMNAGRIDTAIVGGINIIASPASFIAFSQASMLSEAGLCQAFSAKADGFVRGEGGGVLVLRKSGHAQTAKNPIHGYVVATEVNSDGRTNGISLPSLEAQHALLDRIYSRSGIDVDRLAFVEAHGTGTPVGDPIEATALGRSIGSRRHTPLTIGSVKTNIGHLEPASGMAGLLKAFLSLKNGILPPSLHFDEPNPNIDFDKLNLRVCKKSVLLPQSAQSFAGVNSFGFGGTNAHAILKPGPKSDASAQEGANEAGCGLFAFSAASRGALRTLAQDYARRVEKLTDEDTAALASAIVHRRDHLPHRVVVTVTNSQDVAVALNSFVAGEEAANLLAGEAEGSENPIAFVYSGNGSQWAGMGLQAYRTCGHFRDHFDRIDDLFTPLAGWSLKDALGNESLESRLSLTSVAQPLIFAIQSACTAALRARGLSPAMVLGHSVGEIAAAEAAGILDLRTAVKVIFVRSSKQELTRGAGRMMAVIAPAATVEALAAKVGNLEIAAVNSPRAVTIAGASDAIAAFKVLARRERIVVVELNLDYPFHTRLMAPIEHPLISDLRHIHPDDGDVPFVSTVTGDTLVGSRLNGAYWWRNVREPVQFSAAIRAASKLGARHFIEIGPNASLLKHIGDALNGESASFSTMSVLDRRDADIDPFQQAVARALVSGAQLDLVTKFGADPGAGVMLPRYPWQQTEFRLAPTVEAFGVGGERHPFAGARTDSDGLVWRSHIDTAANPALADHKVGEQIIFPGAGFFEIALSVARQWLKSEAVTIANFEILKPLDLTNGESREVMTRVSPGSSTLEIFSRPRLSNAAWLLNCRAKMQHAGPVEACRVPEAPTTGRKLDASQLYHLAEANGLHYGPAFRLVQNVVVHDDRFISVELAAASETSRFSLDPMRLDCATHGLFTLFPELLTEERGVTYIPVRADETILYRPGVAPRRSLIEILSKSERSILANYYIIGAKGELVAVLRRAQCQAVPVRRARSIDQVGLVEAPVLLDGAILGSNGLPILSRQVVSAARKLGFLAEKAGKLDERALLQEGLATAAAYEIASGLAKGTAIDIDALVTGGRIPEALRPWLSNIMIHLEGAGLAHEDHEGWRLVQDGTLPTAEAVFNALADEIRSSGALLLLAGAITGLARKVMAEGQVAADANAILPKSSLDFFDSTNAAAMASSDALSALIRSFDRSWPKSRAIRVLQIGIGSLAQSLSSHFGERIALTVFEPDRRSENADRASLAAQRIKLLDLEKAAKLSQYDLIVSVRGLRRLPTDFGMGWLRGLLLSDGILIATEPQPTFFDDLVFGLDPAWFGAGTSEYPSGIAESVEWTSALEKAGFEDVSTKPMKIDGAVVSLLTAKAGSSLEHGGSGAEDDSRTKRSNRSVYITSGDRLLAPALADILRSDESTTIAGSLSELVEASPDAVLFTGPSDNENADPVAALVERCMDIKTCAENLGDKKPTLWLLFGGALEVGHSPVNPIETGAWAFSRTLANEFQNLDVRRIDIASGIAPAVAARFVTDVVLSGTQETELHIDGETVRAVRVQPFGRSLEQAEAEAAPAATLKRRSHAGSKLYWQAVERKKPGRKEVEIAVEATGVNFRDLMWTLGLIPDDMLEDGFTGPTLGLECAGRVLKVGAAVKGLKRGDRVAAFAASSFSTHVTVPETQVVKLPADLPAEGAATIPVAFVTALYSLVTLGKLQRNEWVLIHGGAGGVGMAAIQIAQARGARIIATAGSPAKRSLLRALGVEHVVDSRSTSFVDDVRSITGVGVDVVLNSLAGEAMERSIACLGPFGRFIELGKRDYVSNTHIGLRPFRKNLSYFGVDIDQLIVGKRGVGEKVYAEVMKSFATGKYKVLPHSVFDAEGVSDAFALMQHSGHVGKVVVRPPSAGSVRAAAKRFAFGAKGTHLITGAFGGFGLETAKWLVDQGVRHLVLVGRKGPTTPEATAALTDFAERGVNVLVERCDVANRQSLGRLVERIRTTMPPLVGVMHAAMVLDDAILTNLNAERFGNVAVPKIDGAENLDFLTRGLPLDYFILFSSVTTLMGNPGQGAYVAANAYMEGLARRRRRQGLPALAVGWGPIVDVGVVARDRRLKSNLQKLTGVTGLRAREALELMAQALTGSATNAGPAVVTISPNEGSFASDRLSVLRSPTYALLVGQGQDAGAADAGRIDLQALIQEKGAVAARRKITEVIVAQLARVLHSREEDISRTRALAEIGLDSLMALELVLNLEEAFGINVALSGSAGALSVAGVADEIIAQAGAGVEDDEALVATLAEQHATTVEVDHIEALRGVASQETGKVRRVLN